MTWAEKGLPFRLPHHTRAQLIYDMAMVTCNRTTVPERFSAIAAPMIATAEDKQVGFFFVCLIFTPDWENGASKQLSKIRFGRHPALGCRKKAMARRECWRAEFGKSPKKG